MLALKLTPALVSLAEGFVNGDADVERDVDADVVEGHFLVSTDLASPENDEPVASVGRL